MTAVAKAIEEVKEINETLRQTLDEMERVLEILEEAEMQKTVDEREIEALRRQLQNLSRRPISGGGGDRDRDRDRRPEGPRRGDGGRGDRRPDPSRRPGEPRRDEVGARDEGGSRSDSAPRHESASHEESEARPETEPRHEGEERHPPSHPPEENPA